MSCFILLLLIVPDPAMRDMGVAVDFTI